MCDFDNRADSDRCGPFRLTAGNRLDPVIGAGAQLPQAFNQRPVRSHIKLRCNHDQVDVAVGPPFRERASRTGPRDSGGCRTGAQLPDTALQIVQSTGQPLDQLRGLLQIMGDGLRLGWRRQFGRVTSFQTVYLHPAKEVALRLGQNNVGPRNEKQQVVAAWWQVARGRDGACFKSLLNGEMHEISRLPDLAGGKQRSGGVQVVGRAVTPINNLCSHVNCHVFDRNNSLSMGKGRELPTAVARQSTAAARRMRSMRSTSNRCHLGVRGQQFKIAPIAPGNRDAVARGGPVCGHTAPKAPLRNWQDHMVPFG